MKMFINFKDHIESNFPFLLKSNLLIAVSGGVDSMVLLHLLEKINLNISVAHCNFQLRAEESNEEENFVKKYCEEHQIHLFVKRFATKEYAIQNKLSIQLAARELRYDWFNLVMKENNFDFLLTGHHLDDQVETFLINFTRGTGIEGLTGIPAINNNIIRVLLPFSREAILNYATENNLQWKEDSSNASDKYFRNKVRHQVIPVLKELNPNFLESFKNTLIHLKTSEQIVNKYSIETLNKLIQVKDNKEFIKISELSKINDYTFYLYQWLKEYGFTAWKDIYQLIQAQTGKQIYSPTHILVKNRDELILSSISKPNDAIYFIPSINEELKFPLKLTLCNLSNINEQNKNSIFVDADKIQFPLIVRKWKEGDVFYPLGMNGSKKVSKFFKDEKFSLFDKQNTWILESNNNIIWIIGYRQDDRFKINETTQTTIKIEFLK